MRVLQELGPITEKWEDTKCLKTSAQPELRSQEFCMDDGHSIACTGCALGGSEMDSPN